MIGKTMIGKTMTAQAMTGRMSAHEANSGEKVSGVASAGIFTAPDVAGSSTKAWQAEVVAFRCFDEIVPLLDGLEGSAFQSRHWLSAWFETLGTAPEIDPFLVVVRNHAGTIAMALPLVRRKEKGLVRIELPDLGVSDCAAPLLRRLAQDHLPPSSALWPLIFAALPQADVLHLDRLCPIVKGMPNPLYGHPWARQNRVSSWVRPLPESWDEYHASLSGSMREKLGKNGRRFARSPQSTIAMVEDRESGLRVLAELERMQAERIQGKGLEYHLDAPELAAFYRRLVETGIESGDTVIAEMRSGEQTVAANFGVRAGNEVTYLRVTNRFGEWARMSPGLLVTEFLMRSVHARGVRLFDFAMGDYDYKRRFGAQQVPLLNLVLPLSLKGLPYAVFWHVRNWAATNPLIRRLTGRDVPAHPAGEDD